MKQNPKTKKQTFASPQVKTNQWVIHMNEKEPDFAVLATSIYQSISSNLNNHIHHLLHQHLAGEEYRQSNEEKQSESTEISIRQWKLT